MVVQFLSQTHLAVIAAHITRTELTNVPFYSQADHAKAFQERFTSVFEDLAHANLQAFRWRYGALVSAVSCHKPPADGSDPKYQRAPIAVLKAAYQFLDQCATGFQWRTLAGCQHVDALIRDFVRMLPGYAEAPDFIDDCT